MQLETPRLAIAGLAGDSGKTLVALGLIRAFAARGLKVRPYKKGPDYIDAAWLAAAAGSAGRNLDTFLMDSRAIGDGLARGMPADLIVIEGNRGLFDGLDAEGSHSTAELAKLLAAPVVLVVDVTKMTRTAAALVVGCKTLDPQVRLDGVVLNRVGTARQERVIREAIEAAGGPPVLGAIPRLADGLLPSRHLGLVTANEHLRREESLCRVAQATGKYIDLDAVLDVARSAAPAAFPDPHPAPSGPSVRIGVVRDESLSFYYPENLEALEANGAELVTVAPLRDGALPQLDGLYLGGGFPEVHVKRLAANRPLLESMRRAAATGMPMYAECGGLMLLARELIVDGESHAMAGVLDLVIEQTARPVGHGYVEAEVDRPNPFFDGATRLRGHEFHYSRVVSGGDTGASCLRLLRGQGIGDRRDGLAVGNVWASYLHVHALGTPKWAGSFTALAHAHRSSTRRNRTERPKGAPDDLAAEKPEQHGNAIESAGHGLA